MKVLYISYDGMTDPLGQSQVIPYLTGLSALGHTITIISCEKKERFEKHQAAIRRQLTGSNIGWLPVSYSRLPSVFSKQFNLSAMHKKAEQFCRDQQPDAIHCRSYMAALIGLKQKRKRKIKFIFDMRGFWADERVDGGIWQLSNPLHRRIYKFFKKKEAAFLGEADYTISLTESAREEIHSWKHVKNQPVPIQIIPCCADLDLFSPASVDSEKQEALKQELQIGGRDLVISYLGSVGTWYMLDEMLDFFKVLLQKRPDARFLFITPDAAGQVLARAAQKNIPAGKLIVRFAARSEVPLFLSLSALSVYFIRPLYSKMASSPTKTAEIMGLGIPLITNTGIGDSDRILQEAGSGLLITGLSMQAYIRAAAQLDTLLNTDKEAIIRASHSHFSLDKGIQLYNDVYRKLKS